MLSLIRPPRPDSTVKPMTNQENKGLRKYNGSRNPDGRKALPPEQVKQKVTAYIPQELIDYYRELAHVQRRTFSQVLGLALEAYADQLKQEPTQAPTGD